MTATRVGLCIVLASVSSVSCRVPGHRFTGPYPPPITRAAYAVLGDPAGSTTLERPASLLTSAGPSYRIVFTVEPSPVRQTLRGVRIEEPFWGDRHPDMVYAVGDGGTLLRRFAAGPWEQIDSGTTEDLYALSCGPTPRPFAVGANGTVRHVGVDGKWVGESTGTTVTLRAVSSIYAAGDEGTLLEREPDGRWTAVPTGTKATLRGLWNDFAPGRSALYVVGDEGTILRCQGSPLSCARQPSGTSDDLLAIEKGDLDHAYAATHGLAAKPHFALIPTSSGRFVELEAPTEPFRWGLAPRMDFGPVRFVAVARNDWMWAVGDLWTWAEPLAVGLHGAAAVATGVGLLPVAMPTAHDLYAVDAGMLDVFAVGDAGTIVHGVVEGAAIPVAVEE